MLYKAQAVLMDSLIIMNVHTLPYGTELLIPQIDMVGHTLDVRRYFLENQLEICLLSTEFAILVVVSATNFLFNS